MEKIKLRLFNIRKKITTAYIAKVAILSAIAFILYMYCKFNLPFIFPQFMDMQFSELPALLAGFSLGPFAGGLVVVIKCLLKFPFSGTGFAGETMDMILGLCYVIPSSLIYTKNKTKRGAIIGLCIGTGIATALSLLFNRYIAIPMYVKLFFNNNFDTIVGMLSGLYPNLNRDNFYIYYIFVGVLPFNLLRLGLVSLITFFVYKKLSRILHWEIDNNKKKVIRFVQEDISLNNNIQQNTEENVIKKKSDETNCKNKE